MQMIVGSSCFTKTITQTRLDRIFKATSLEEATYMGTWDKIGDWFSGNSKFKASAALYRLACCEQNATPEGQQEVSPELAEQRKIANYAVAVCAYAELRSLTPESLNLDDLYPSSVFMQWPIADQIDHSLTIRVGPDQYQSFKFNFSVSDSHFHGCIDTALNFAETEYRERGGGKARRVVAQRPAMQFVVNSSDDA